MARNVICIANTEEQAVKIVDKLKAENFSKDDISILYSDRSGSRDFAHEKNTKVPEGITAGATTGGALGAAIGWQAGVGALGIPGVGPLMVAGPIVSLLTGAGIGAAAGGMAGALMGMGIPEYEAKRYEGKIKEGNILVSVRSEDRSRLKSAKEIFQESGAKDIATTGESSMSSELSQAEQPQKGQRLQEKNEKDKNSGKDKIDEPEIRPGTSQINKDSTTSTPDPKDPEIPGKEEPRV